VCAHLPAPAQLQGDWSWRRAFALAFAVGIRPCTGAILVLVFAIGQGLWWAGVLSTLAMALGTAITVSALAALAVGSRELAKRLAGSGGSSKWADRVQMAAGLGGAGLVFTLGLFFFVASLSSMQPF
jgi:nickel/cobalt transporter (NicO) family protein